MYMLPVCIDRQKSKRAGQALVEFVLMLLLAFSMAIIVQRITRSSIRTIWVRMAAEIAPPCPASVGCVRPEAIPEQ
jgi:hypothetical protein